MAVREWDPVTGSDDEIEAIVATLNAVFATDLPDDPAWRSTGLREYLCETMPGERRFCWIADGEIDATGSGVRPVPGHANLLLLGDIGVIEVIVHPQARHRGVGRALVRAAARLAYAEGVASIGVEVIGGTPAMKFWESLGFRRAFVEMRSVLDLSSVDWPGVARMAATSPEGYRVVHHAATLPAELLEPYAAAKAARREETGQPELDLRPSSYDAQRLAASLDTLRRRGMRPYLVLAVHEPTGVVAALTEVVVPAQHPTRADQYDTIVVPGHRGRGLEHAIKARMLQELRRAEPQLTEVQTWNAPEHDPMAQVNAALGYRPDREWCEYESGVLELVERLGH